MSATLNSVNTAAGLSVTRGDKRTARLLAIVMHAAFVVLLIFGVSWQKKPPEPVMADLWSNLPQLLQPKPVEQPEVEPAPKLAPPPAPKVAPPPVPKVVPAPASKPDIALQDKDKKKKVEPKPEPKVETKPEPKPKPEAKKAEDDTARREAQRKAAEAEKEAQEKAAAEKAAAAERAAKAAAAARENQKYIGGIRGKVYARVALPPDLQGNPEAVFVVSLLPGGELLNVVLRTSSGNPAYDAAVERAIRQAQPFDVPSGEQFQQYFRQFPMVFRPKG